MENTIYIQPGERSPTVEAFAALGSALDFWLETSKESAEAQTADDLPDDDHFFWQMRYRFG